jgi:hypothetical protein
MLRADTTFVLRAMGEPDATCQTSMNFSTDRFGNLCELEVAIPTAEYTKITSGAALTPHPARAKKGYEWRVRDNETPCTGPGHSEQRLKTDPKKDEVQTHE